MSESNLYDSMQDATITFTSAVGSVAVFVLKMAITILFGAWAFCVLWGWFVVPAFHAPAMTMPLAIGLDMVSFHFRSSPSASASQKRTKGEERADFIARSILIPAWALLVGYVVHLVMT
jgi:hypothetical protein